MRLLATWALGAALLGAAAGCAGPPASVGELTVYVGEDGRGDASIALAVAPDRALLYRCPDDPLHGDPPGWLAGPRDPGRDDVELGGDAWSVRGAWDGESASLVTTGPDGSDEVTLRAVDPEALDGLYLEVGERCATGVIVDEPLVRGAWWCESGAVAQVTPLFPLRVEEDRLLIELELQSGARPAEVPRLRLPLPAP